MTKDANFATHFVTKEARTPTRSELEKELPKIIKEMKTSTFRNEHGEKFVIHSNDISVFMSGDEVNAMVEDKNKMAKKYIPLFNQHFGIWSGEELYKLGVALTELHKEYK